jgi:hypothetical protein
MALQIDNRYVGEVRLYRQQIYAGDTIIAAIWTVNPSVGCILSNATTVSDSTTVLLSCGAVGTFVLEAKLQLASGQILFGLIQVIVNPNPGA